MNTYVCWVTNTADTVARKAFSNDVEGIRRFNRDIENAVESVKSFVELAGGSMVSDDNSTGSFELPASYLTQLPKVKESFEKTVGLPVGLGVGMKISEAERAVKLAGKLGNITFYSPHVEEKLKQFEEEESKEQELGLKKAIKDTTDFMAPTKMGFQKIRIIPAPEADSFKRYNEFKEKGTPTQNGYIEYPRVPSGPLAGEDTNERRISIAPSLPAAFAGLIGEVQPSEVGDILQTTPYDKLRVYGLKNVQDKHGFKPNKYYVQDRVPDAQLTQEEWLTEPTEFEYVGHVLTPSPRFDKVSWRQLPTYTPRLIHFSNGIVPPDFDWENPELFKKSEINYQEPDTSDYSKFVVVPESLLKDEHQGMLAPQAKSKPVPPKAEASEHSENEGLFGLLNEERQPAPEGTHAAKDFEDHFHQLAQEQQAKERPSAENVEQAKQQLAQALQAVKTQAPILGEIKQKAPELYQAVMGVVQATINLGRAVQPAKETPIQKSESEDDFEEIQLEKAESPKYVSLVHFSPHTNLNRIGVRHMGTGASSEEYKQGLPDTKRAYYYEADTRPEYTVMTVGKARYAGKINLHQHKIYDLGIDQDGLIPLARKVFLAGRGKENLSDTILSHVKKAGYCGYKNSDSSSPNVIGLFHDLDVVEFPMEGNTKIPEDVSKKLKSTAHPVKTKKSEIEPETPKKEETKDKPPLKKMALPMPKAPKRINLPVGTALEGQGKVKVQHADGTTGWRSVRAGQMLSQDPSGHPTSTRSPNSK